LLIEALKPLKILLPDGPIHLVPGVPMELPEKQAQKLFLKAPGKVKRVMASSVSLVGHVATWESPLFGRLSGAVLEDNGQHVTVWHPLAEREVTIPKAWVVEWQKP
jgi:hypothetical protein